MNNSLIEARFSSVPFSLCLADCWVEKGKLPKMSLWPEDLSGTYGEYAADCHNDVERYLICTGKICAVRVRVMNGAWQGRCSWLLIVI